MDNGASSYRRFLDGDDAALNELIRSYSDGLTLYINSITRNICIAEELTEEVFVELCVKRPRFSGKSTFKTWLFAIARHTAIDWLRKAEKKRLVPIDDYYNMADKEDIEREYLKTEQKAQLHKALDRINPDHAQVLYLVYFENFSNSETADIMKKSNRQIENLLYRAKQSLKEELRREGFVYEEL
ncbi:MAG TPA: RNA polymerase sigma factor [Ruminococcus sp.]|nr:RNA polymerase sigma factor [Ruminococcus sp.]